MRSLRILASLAMVVLAATAMSCATTKTDVDLTPTASTKVDAHLGKGWNSDSTQIENISSNFRPEDVLYLVADVPGDATGTLRVRWMSGSSVVMEQTATVESGKHRYPFKLAASPPLAVGDYKVEVWLNDKLADTEHFKIAT